MAQYPYNILEYKKPTNTIEDLIAQYQTAETEAREKQLGQVEKAREYLQQIVDIYGAEGAYGKGMEMVLESQKKQDVGKAAQTGISSGLYGIRNYGAEWESTVGTKARATLEDIRQERRAQALSGLAGFEAGVEYTPPDYGALMQAVAAGQQVPSGTYGAQETGYGGSTSGGTSGGVIPMSEFGTTQPWETPGAPSSYSSPATTTPGTSAYGASLAARQQPLTETAGAAYQSGVGWWQGKQYGMGDYIGTGQQRGRVIGFDKDGKPMTTPAPI